MSLSAPRTASIQRETSESSIELSINLDGTGVSDIQTSVPFYDHLLTAFAKHSLTDITVRAKGDIEIDAELDARFARLAADAGRALCGHG